MIVFLYVELACLQVDSSEYGIYLSLAVSLCAVGGMMSLAVKSKTADTVKCEVVDGGELKSRRHLNVRGKSATLPSITGRLISP